MKTFKFLTIFASLSLINFLSATPCNDGDCGHQHQHDPSSDEFLIPSDSNCENPTPTHCEVCEDEYVYECVNKWIPYNLDDAPATDGLFAGFYKGDPIFVGRALRGKGSLSGRVQIIDPRGVYRGRTFVNDPKKIWYLQKDPNHLYEWVESANGSVVPFAVDVGDCQSDDGSVRYISKIELKDGSITIGAVPLTVGLNVYADLEANTVEAREYVILTCRSKVHEPEPACPSPSEEPSEPQTGCVHEWKPYIGDDAPAVDGISAGFFDADEEAYVGKVFDGILNKPGRISLNQPGIFSAIGGKNFVGTEDTFYLVSNPGYNYRWIDASGPRIIPNAVTVKSDKGFIFYIGRIQINGQIEIVAVSQSSGTGYYPGEDGLQHTTIDYQVLVCDPEPACPCEAYWESYKNDRGPEVDGIPFGYIGDEINYIGRAVQKLPEGYSTVIGRVDLTDGVYYLNDASGDEKLEADEGEYLWKCPESTYEWVSSHTDKKVWNAIKVPIRCENFTLCESSIGCDEDGRSAYIGRATVDGVSYVGTVYKNEGLVIADSCGNKMTLSNFEVLTCATSGRCQEREQKCGETPCKWQEDEA